MISDSYQSGNTYIIFRNLLKIHIKKTHKTSIGYSLHILWMFYGGLTVVQ
nr:MAG TPA: hypothetical protein [Caudoviricetes sp.]